MTKLLKQALDRLSALPDSEQEVVAARILAELDDEERWQRSFAASQGVLESLADEALEDDRQGKTIDGEW